MSFCADRHVEENPCLTCVRFRSTCRLCKSVTFKRHTFLLESGCSRCYIYKVHLMRCAGCKELTK